MEEKPAEPAEDERDERHTFGPVPSRRLGRSLGINNIPAKHCPYSCVYCQVGRNTCHSAGRSAFYEPASLVGAARRRLRAAHSLGEKVDYIAFVPDGEPTLDINLGTEIRALKQLGVPVAVFTNASTLIQPGVVSDLQGADLVSVKVDSVSEKTWRAINRPCKGLALEEILGSILSFCIGFKGRIITETMVIDATFSREEIRLVAGFLGSMPRLEKAYISTTTRPPDEHWVRRAPPGMMRVALDVFAEVLGPSRVEPMERYEGDAFTSTGEVERDFLNIIAVHPMRDTAAIAFFKMGGLAASRLDELVLNGVIEKKNYTGHAYYKIKASPSRSG